MSKAETRYLVTEIRVVGLYDSLAEADAAVDEAETIQGVGRYATECVFMVEGEAEPEPYSRKGLN